MTQQKAHKVISLELENVLALPGAPPDIDLEEAIPLLFRFFDHQPKIDSLALFSDGLIDAFAKELHHAPCLKIEVFIKALILLVDKNKFKEMNEARNEEGDHLNMLSAFAKEAGLKEHNKDSRGPNNEGIPRFHIGRYWKTLNKSRNLESHEAEALPGREKSARFEAACVIYVWLIDKYSDTIKLALLTGENRAYLERTVSANKGLRATHVEITVVVTREDSTDPLGRGGGFKMDLSSLAKKSPGRGGAKGRGDHRGPRGTFISDLGGTQSCEEFIREIDRVLQGRDRSEKTPNPPTAARILVDGYSLLETWRSLEPDAPRHSDRAREALISVLSQYAERVGKHVTLFFGYHDSHANIAANKWLESLEIVYTREGKTAQDLIERTAHRNRNYGELLTVTNDQEFTTASLSYHSHPRSILLGSPGGGKTTTLKLIELTQSEDLLAGDYSQTSFPIYIRLNDFNREAGIGIKELIQESFPQTEFEDLLKNQVILLLDGLNEVRSDEIADVIQEVVDIEQQLVAGRMIVSTRPQAFLGSIKGAHLEIQTLDDALMSELVSKHMGDDAEKSEACQKFLKEDPQLTEWARNPLHLYMLAETYRTLDAPPENRGHLLEAFVCHLHEREALQGKYSCDINTLNTLLGHLAIDNIQTGNFHRAWHDVVNVLKASAAGIGTTIDIPKLITTLSDNNLLRGQTDGEVGFSHEMYQDYFAARLWTEDESLIDFEADREMGKWIQVLHIRNDLINDPSDVRLLERLAKVDCWAAYQAVVGCDIDRTIALVDLPRPDIDPEEVKYKTLAHLCLQRNKPQNSEAENKIAPALKLILDSAHTTYLANVEEWKRSKKDDDKSDLETKVARCLLIRLMLGDYQGVMDQLGESLDEELAVHANEQSRAFENLAHLTSIIAFICEELSKPDKAIPGEFDDWLNSLLETGRINFLVQIAGGFDDIYNLQKTFLITNRLSFRALEILHSVHTQGEVHAFHLLRYGLSLAFAPPILLPSGRDEARGLSIYRYALFKWCFNREGFTEYVNSTPYNKLSVELLSVIALTNFIIKANPKLLYDSKNLVGEIVDHCKQEGLDSHILAAQYFYHLHREEYEAATECCKKALATEGELGPFQLKSNFALGLAGHILDRKIDDKVSDALEVLRPFAESGDSECMFVLGKALIWDVPVSDRNVPEGIRILETAAKMGHQEAMVRLGEIHCGEDDLGIKKNSEIGIGWLENAVKEGSDEAMLLLGRELRKSDIPRARDLLFDAREKGNVEAGLELFEDYYNAPPEETHKRSGELLSKMLEILKGVLNSTELPEEKEVQFKKWQKQHRELGKVKSGNKKAMELAEKFLEPYQIQLPNEEPDTWRAWQLARAAERFRLRDPKVFNPAAARLYEEFRKRFLPELKRVEERGPELGQTEEDFDEELIQERIDYDGELREEIVYHLVRNPDPEIGRNLFFQYLDYCLKNDGMYAGSFLSGPLTDWTKQEKRVYPKGTDLKALGKTRPSRSADTPEHAERIIKLAHEALDYVKPEHYRQRRDLAFLLIKLHDGKHKFIAEDSEEGLEGMKKLLYCDPPDIVALRHLIAYSGNQDGFPSNRSASQEYIEAYLERVPGDLFAQVHKAALSLYYGDYSEAEQVADIIGKISKSTPEKGRRHPPETTPQYASDIIKAYARSKNDPAPVDLPTPLDKNNNHAQEGELTIAHYLHALLLAKGLDKGFQDEKGWREADKLMSLWGDIAGGMHPIFFLNPDDADFHILSALLIRNNQLHQYNQRWSDEVDSKTLAEHLDKAKAGSWEMPDWMHEIKKDEEEEE